MAQAVLAGRTRGYRHHPQLERFRSQRDPMSAIGAYLSAVCREAEKRGYSFDRSKIVKPLGRARIRTTSGQMGYEKNHLIKKLNRRDAMRLQKLKETGGLRPHPVFAVVDGGIETWEKAKRG